MVEEGEDEGEAGEGQWEEAWVGGGDDGAKMGAGAAEAGGGPMSGFDPS